MGSNIPRKGEGINFFTFGGLSHVARVSTVAIVVLWKHNIKFLHMYCETNTNIHQGKKYLKQQKPSFFSVVPEPKLKK